jgi:hypothetical protein
MKIKESEADRLALKLDTDSTGDLKFSFENYILFSAFRRILIILRKI